MLDYALTRAYASDPAPHTFTARDTMLYALGIGLGADPMDERQLRYVYEKDLLAFPTMACVLASPGFWMRDRRELGIDAMKLVHGEQSIELHAPLPAAGTVLGRSRVTRVVDKGPGKGAVVHVEKLLHDESGSRLLATVEQVLFCRGDGGFSAADARSDPPADPPRPVPAERAPDHSVQVPVRPDAALLYRLSGDLNPLHADPAMARRVGFERPILHGLATYGIAARELVARWANYEAGRLKSLRARLSAPVLPGETLLVESWQVESGLAFQVRVPERGVVVLSHGSATLAS